MSLSKKAWGIDMLKWIFLNKQRGSILVISVIILAVLAGLSITVLSSSINEKNISSNVADQNLAQQSASTALANVKQLISDSWAVGSTLCSGAPCGSSTPQVWSSSTAAFNNIDFTQQTVTWWNQYAKTVSASSSSLASDPQYIIISLGCDAISNAYRFRIIIRAVGGTTSAVAFKEAIFTLAISNQNASLSAGTVQIKGVVNQRVQQTFNMSPSSASSGFFFRNWSGPWCPQSGSSYASCEMNCAGQIRVMAWTHDGHCINTYGPWSSTVSSVTVSLNGTNYNVACQFPIICNSQNCIGTNSGSCATCQDVFCNPTSGCSTSAPKEYCPGTTSPCMTQTMSCESSTCAGAPTTGCQSCTNTTCGGSPCSCATSTRSYCPGTGSPCTTASCPPSPPQGSNGLPWPTVNPNSGPSCTIRCWENTGGGFRIRGGVTVAGSYIGGNCTPSGYGSDISIISGLSDYCSYTFGCCSPCAGCSYPSGCSQCSSKGRCAQGGAGGYCWGGSG